MADEVAVVMTPTLDTWMLLLAAVGATYFWRGLAVPLSSRIDPESRVFEWMTCVTYALLAGLMSRMIVLPFGDLAATPLHDRIIAVGIGLAAFFVGRRNLLLGVGAGTSAFILLTFTQWGS